MNYGTTGKTKIMKIEKYQRFIWRTISNLKINDFVEILRVEIFVEILGVKHKLCIVSELHTNKLCKILMKAYNRDIDGTEQFYTKIFSEELIENFLLRY